MKKATIESLLADKAKGKYDSLAIKTVEVPAIGYSFDLKKPKLDTILSILNQSADDSSMSDNIRFMCDIVYQACPMLHNTQLLEEFEVKEPPEIVMAVLNDNLDALYALSDEVLSFYGINNLENMVKN